MGHAVDSEGISPMTRTAAPTRRTAPLVFEVELRLIIESSVSSDVVEDLAISVHEALDAHTSVDILGVSVCGLRDPFGIGVDLDVSAHNVADAYACIGQVRAILEKECDIEFVNETTSIEKAPEDRELVCA